MLDGAEIPHLIADLHALNASTESGFLDVGGRLTEFVSAARSVRRDIQELAEIVAGSSCARVLAALEAVLAQAAAMQQNLGNTVRTLAALHQKASDVQEAFQAFRAGVHSFRMVSTLGRIETARIGNRQNDLGQFAAAVAAGTERIDRSVRRALDSAAALVGRINSTITSLSGLDTRQINSLPELVRAVQESVAAIRHREELAREVSENLEREFASLCGAIDTLVTELQFHDITRQQIEHAIETLESVDGAVSPESAAVIELQRRQLASAASAFTRSAAHIKDELARIAGAASQMDVEATSLHELAGHRQDSFFVQTGDVLEALSAGAALSAQTCGLTAGLAEDAAGLDACIGDIREISSVVRYLGINAAISGFHLGPAGAPLGIVAQAMRSLHSDVEQRATAAEERVAGLGASLSTIGPDHSGDDTAAAAFREGVSAMRLAAESAGSFSARIGTAVTALSDAVRSAAEGFTAGALVESTLDRCCRALERIVLQSGFSVDSAAALQRFADRYTMHAEREVHAGMDGGMAACAVLSPPPAGDFGENVELF